jgi:hypothetical protein
MIIRRVAILLLALCSAASAVTNGWQLSVNTNGVVQPPPRVTTFGFTNPVTMTRTLSLSEITGSASVSITSGDVLSLGPTGNRIDFDNDAEMIIATPSFVLNDGSATMLRLQGGVVTWGAGFSNAVQAAAPTPVVTNVNYATNAGTAASLSVPYVTTVNGSTGAVTLASGFTNVVASGSVSVVTTGQTVYVSSAALTNNASATLSALDLVAGNITNVAALTSRTVNLTNGANSAVLGATTGAGFTVNGITLFRTSDGYIFDQSGIGALNPWLRVLRANSTNILTWTSSRIDVAGDIAIRGTNGFTGSGNFTNFTIRGGIIIQAQ